MLVVAGGFQWEAFSRDYNWVILGVTVYLAILSATAFTIWNRLIERYNVNVLSAFRFMIPLCGVIESAVFLKSETIGVGIVVGGAVLLVSLFAMSRIETKVSA